MVQLYYTRYYILCQALIFKIYTIKCKIPPAASKTAIDNTTSKMTNIINR